MEQILLQKLRPSFMNMDEMNSSEIWEQDLVFQKGERIQIVAPSGSGKTSLIHFIYGMRKDYEGKILLDKNNLETFNKDRKAAVRSNEMSVIFQDLRLFPDQTAYKNIEIKYLLQPFAQNNITAMAEKLGIGNKMQQMAGTCSYGEQQRIAIIRSLQQPFDFLLLDEPFSHLDEHNREVAMELMEQEATTRGAAIILADLRPTSFFKANRTLHL